MDFDDAEYERRLERWALNDLPMFRIKDWQGTYGGGISGGLFRSTSKYQRLNSSVTMTRTVWHHQPGTSIEIRVISSRPDPNLDEETRQHSALTNMAIQIVNSHLADGTPAEEHNRAVDELANRLRAGEYPRTTEVLVVGGFAIEFDVLAIGEVWAAFGSLEEDVDIDIQAHGVPFGAFRHSELIEMDASPIEEDARWCERAEDFLMAHGRWVPSFVHGWPTWFGNRKAGGLRGIPEDLAYLRDSLLKRNGY